MDASKTEYVDGNCIEHGDTERDYVVKDALGRVLKESAYSEMDDYLIVKEYTYNKKAGWKPAYLPMIIRCLTIIRKRTTGATGHAW